MLNRFLYKKNHFKTIRHFATYNKPPNPNNQDFGPFIMVCLIYLGIDLVQKFSEYPKGKK